LQGIDTAQTFDLDVVTEQSMENPVYYVQYAHARVASIARKAARGGCRAPAVGRVVDLAPLVHERELELLRALASIPTCCTKRPRRARRRRSARGCATSRPSSTASTATAGDHRRRRAHPGPALAHRGVPDRPRQRARVLGVSAPDEMARLDATTKPGDEAHEMTG
jgi:hypothetical protein